MWFKLDSFSNSFLLARNGSKKSGQYSLELSLFFYAKDSTLVIVFVMDGITTFPSFNASVKMKRFFIKSDSIFNNCFVNLWICTRNRTHCIALMFLPNWKTSSLFIRISFENRSLCNLSLPLTETFSPRCWTSATSQLLEGLISSYSPIHIIDRLYFHELYS